MKAEGIDTVINETFSLTNRSCRYGAIVIHFGAILKLH